MQTQSLWNCLMVSGIYEARGLARRGGDVEKNTRLSIAEVLVYIFKFIFLLLNFIVNKILKFQMHRSIVC